MRYGEVAEKPAAASTAETIRWSEQELPGGVEVKEWSLSMTGTARDYDAIDRIKAKAGGALVWDVNELQHAALIQFYTKKAFPSATDVRFNIPYYFGGVPGMVLGAPPRNHSVEIDIDNTPSATGVVRLAYTLGEANATHYPLFLASDANIAASSTRRGFPITQPGLLRGFVLPDTGDINRVIVVVGNQTIMDVHGALMLAIQENMQGGTVTTNRYVQTPLVNIIPGSTHIYLDTAAGWGGATEEIAVHSLVPISTPAQ